MSSRPQGRAALAAAIGPPTPARRSPIASPARCRSAPPRRARIRVEPELPLSHAAHPRPGAPRRLGQARRRSRRYAGIPPTPIRPVGNRRPAPGWRPSAAAVARCTVVGDLPAQRVVVAVVVDARVELHPISSPRAPTVAVTLPSSERSVTRSSASRPWSSSKPDRSRWYCAVHLVEPSPERAIGVPVHTLGQRRPPRSPSVRGTIPAAMDPWGPVVSGRDRPTTGRAARDRCGPAAIRNASGTSAPRCSTSSTWGTSSVHSGR